MRRYDLFVNMKCGTSYHAIPCTWTASEANVQRYAPESGAWAGRGKLYLVKVMIGGTACWVPPSECDAGELFPFERMLESEAQRREISREHV